MLTSISTMSGDDNRDGSGPTISGAITAPPDSSGSGRPLPFQPRQPRNLQGLLRFAMEATRREDAPGASEFGPMDEERRKFLQEALRSLTVDVARVLQDATKVLSDQDRVREVGSTDPVPQDIQSALDNLMDFVDDIDVANDFYKIGGFSIFPVLLGAQSDALRASACELLATVSQNNPYTQSRLLETGLFNIILSMAENEQAGNVVAMTAYALSCTTREFIPACQEFIAQNGCDILIRLLKFDKVQVRTKAAFLATYFCKHFPEAKAQLLQKGLVSVLSGLLVGERDNSSEHILSTLVSITEGQDPAAMEQILCPSNNLKENIEKYMATAKLDENTDYIEEREYCETLLRIVKNVKPYEDTVER